MRSASPITGGAYGSQRTGTRERTKRKVLKFSPASPVCLTLLLTRLRGRYPCWEEISCATAAVILAWIRHPIKRSWWNTVLLDLCLFQSQPVQILLLTAVGWIAFLFFIRSRSRPLHVSRKSRGKRCKGEQISKTPRSRIRQSCSTI